MCERIKIRRDVLSEDGKVLVFNENHFQRLIKSD